MPILRLKDRTCIFFLQSDKLVWMQVVSSPTVAVDDVIDVEVLWEDGEDRAVPGGYRTAVMGTGGALLAPLRITSPAQAAQAYRSAASTSAQPHSLIDLFA